MGRVCGGAAGRAAAPDTRSLPGAFPPPRPTLPQRGPVGRGAPRRSHPPNSEVETAMSASPPRPARPLQHPAAPRPGEWPPSDSPRDRRGSRSTHPAVSPPPRVVWDPGMRGRLREARGVSPLPFPGSRAAGASSSAPPPSAGRARPSAGVRPPPSRASCTASGDRNATGLLRDERRGRKAECVLQIPERTHLPLPLPRPVVGVGVDGNGLERRKLMLPRPGAFRRLRCPGLCRGSESRWCYER